MVLAQPRNGKHAQIRRAIVPNSPPSGTTDNTNNNADTTEPDSGNTNAANNGNTNNNAANGNTAANTDNSQANSNSNNPFPNTGTTDNGNTDTTGNDLGLGNTGNQANPDDGQDTTDNGNGNAGAVVQPTTSSTSAAQAKSTSAAAAQSVVVITTTSSAAPSSTSAAASQLPTTMSGMNVVTQADPYPTVMGTRTFATDNWLSATTANPTGTAGAASSNPGVGSIIGIVGGGLLALVCLAAGAGYIFRRTVRKRRDRERWNRSRFVRNSVAIPDNDFNEKPQMGTKNALALARANNGFLNESAAEPRPPSMVERRAQAAHGVGDVVNDQQQEAGYYDTDGQYVYNNNYQDAHGNQYDYNYGNGQYSNDQYGYDATTGYAAPADQQQPTAAGRQPVRYDQQAGGQEAGSYDEYYNQDAGHQSVTSYQQEQYDEINRQLNPASGNTAEAGQGNASVSRQLSTTYTSLNPKQPSKTYNQPDLAERSGTPTDRNPQQTYFPPTQSNAASPANQYATPGRYRSTPTRALHRSDA